MTKKEIDALFTRINDPEFSKELRKAARELYADCKDNEHFDHTLRGFFSAMMQSITVAGIIPKPFAMALLVMFVLGQRQALGINSDLPALPPAPGMPEIPLSEEEMEKLRKEIDNI